MAKCMLKSEHQYPISLFFNYYVVKPSEKLRVSNNICGYLEKFSSEEEHKSPPFFERH